MILIMALGFSLLVRTPPLGNNFILFFATGHVPFTFYQTISNATARSIKFSKALLSYPVITWVDAVLARALLNTLTGILVAYIIFAGVLLMQNDPVVVDWGPIVESMLLALLVATGVGTLNCALMGLLPIWEQIWSIVSRPLFIASGVLILYETLPPVVQGILWFNPLLHVTALMREGFYPSYEPSFVSVTYTTATGLILLFLGVVLLGRHHRRIMNS